MRLTVHGAGANLRPDPRWSYICTYFPTDSRYNGMPSHDADGYGFKVGFPMDHPTFPKVHGDTMPASERIVIWFQIPIWYKLRSCTL